MVHQLKTINPYFSSIWDGTKSFELRKNGRNFQLGDTLILRGWVMADGSFTGWYIHATIIYILDNFEGVCSGFCILGILVTLKVDGTTPTDYFVNGN